MMQIQQRNLGKVIAKAWADPAFKERLKIKPKEALATMGVKLPEGVDIEVVENSAEKAYLILPAAPSWGVLSASELEATVCPGGQSLDMYTQYSPHSCCPCS